MKVKEEKEALEHFAGVVSSIQEYICPLLLTFY